MGDSDNLKAEIAARLKQARKTLKLTQESLCQRTGMPLSSFKDYEGGKRIPGGEALTLFMRAGINPSWVLSGVGLMLPPDLMESQRRLIHDATVGNVPADMQEAVAVAIHNATAGNVPVGMENAVSAAIQAATPQIGSAPTATDADLEMLEVVLRVCEQKLTEPRTIEVADKIDRLVGAWGPLADGRPDLSARLNRVTTAAAILRPDR